MDFTRPIASRTRARRELRYRSLLQQPEEKKKPDERGLEREAKRKEGEDSARRQEWVPVDVEGGEYLDLECDGSESVSTCNGSSVGCDLEEMEGAGSSYVKVETLGWGLGSGSKMNKQEEISEVGRLGGSLSGSTHSFGVGGGKLGLVKGGKSDLGSGKLNNPGAFDRGSSTKSTGNVGSENPGNLGKSLSVGTVDDDDDDDEVLVLGVSWCLNDNGGNRVSTIIVESGSELDSEDDTDADNRAVSHRQVQTNFRSTANCVEKCVKGRNLSVELGKESDKAGKSCEDDGGTRVTRKNNKGKDSRLVDNVENEAYSDLGDLESSSSEDNGSDNMDYKMDKVTESVSCEESDSDSELGGKSVDDGGGGDDRLPAMKDGVDDCSLMNDLDDTIDYSRREEEDLGGEEDRSINCVAQRTRSHYRSTIQNQKPMLFGTSSHPFLIDGDDELIVYSPKHEEEMKENENHGGQSRHNAGKKRNNLSIGSYRSGSGRKRGRGNRENMKEVKNTEQEKYNEDYMTPLKQLKCSCNTKFITKGGGINVEKKGSEEKKCDHQAEEDAGDYDIICDLDAKPHSSDQFKMSSEDKVLQKGSKTKVPQKRGQISELKDHVVHEILLNSIMGSGELDTYLDELGEGRKEASTADESLQYKFIFGVQQPDESVESETDEELDSLWKELDLCIANSWIGSSDSCWDSSEEATPCGTDQESRCHQGKHQLVLNEEIGVLCKFCSHVNLEIKHVMAPFSEHPFGKLDRRDYYDRVDHSVLDKTQLEDSGCNHLECGDDLAFRPSGTVWDIIPGIKKGMYPHQREGFEFLWRNIAGSTNLDELGGSKKLNQGGCIISHAPGTGKTRLAIVFILSYMKLHKKSRPVIIAPSNMLLTWEVEMRKWNVGIPFHNLNTYELSGKEDIRVLGLLKRHQDLRKVRLAKLFSWERDESILGISYRLFEQLVGGKIGDNFGNDGLENKKHKVLLNAEKEKVQKMLLELPGLLVLDEGHIPRNDESLIFRDLSRVVTENRIILSGTPFQNSLSELYNTLRLVRPQFPDMILSGKVPKDVQTRCGRKRAKLGKRAFVHTMANDAHLDELRTRMEPFVHVHKGTVLQKTLPGIRDFVVVVQLSELQTNLLERCQQRYRKGLDMDYRVSLVTLHPWLYTCFSEKDPTFFDWASLEKIKGDNSSGVKTKFLMELICRSMILEEKVLVFSQFLKPLEFIKEKLESQLNWHLGQEMLFMSGELEDKSKQSMMSSFNDPSSTVRVLLASTKACSEGISLVGASRVVLLDTVWNPSVERQAIGRAYRIGQKRVVHVYHLIAAKTHEEEKQLRQIEKGRLSELVFSANRENEEERISAQVSEDKILDEMVHSEKLKPIFEKIYPPGADSNLVENFGWMEE